MGKITDALKKAAEDRIEHIDKLNRVRENQTFVVKKIADSRVDPRIVTYFDPKAVISEQYKILRTNILSLNKGQPPRSMIITSSTQGEGKTVTALNLAMALAHSKRDMKILVIDADLRRGRISRYLGVEQTLGLAEILNGECSLAEAVFTIDVPNLSFVASGQVPANPVEILDSRLMSQLIEQARGQFSMVIIDTPPILSVTDAGIIGALTDGVLMVIRAGQTQRNMVRRAEELLYQAHARVLGHVLTNIEYHVPEYIYRYM